MSRNTMTQLATLLDEKMKPINGRLDEINNSLDEKIKPINDRLDEIDNSLDEKMKPINNRLGKIDNSLTFVLDEVTKISVIEDQYKVQQKEIQDIASELIAVKEENCALRELVLKQETYSRRKNLKILGLSCNSEQPLDQVLVETFERAGIEISLNNIERAHYIGRPRDKEARPVLVRFVNWKDKEKILRGKEKLRQTQILVQEDFPVEVIQRRRLLLPIFYKSRESRTELNPKFNVDRLILGGKVYTVDNIHTIDFPELQPRNVFTPSKLGVQGFFSRFSPLSNHYISKFKIDGKVFNSSEQFFMHKKALFFKDNETAARILAAKDASQAKFLGRSVKGYHKEKWLKVAPELMFEAMFAKFSQNEDLKAFLLSTGKNTLVEANPHDKFWGCGKGLGNNDIFDLSSWNGKNIAGKTLEKVRQTLQ